MIGPKASEAWAKLGDDVTRKRAVLEALGTRVVINKASRRGPGFNPDDVDVEFGVSALTARRVPIAACYR